ncbi:MAG TPA: efflux RND transporter periplasmic adaptor subunit [Gammaproteobacteria bacterium]|nr:efflux RND transporter periplasmic adaptor subunit [Gammaproteobacteria bacterium]
MSTGKDEVVEALGLDGRVRRGKRRWLWVAIPLVAVAAVIGVQHVRRPNAPTYVTEPAREGPLRVTVTATGTLQPVNQVDVGSEVSGIIAKVLVDFNDPVQKGQVIAQLDTQTLEARVASARASLAVAEAAQAQAEATVTETKAKLARSRELAARDIASQQTLESDQAAAQRAVAQVESAKAQVTAQRAALQESETALGKAMIRSPIDGVVISREVRTGQTVAASFQTPVLFKLADDLRHMELHLNVDESDVGQVRTGQKAEFRVDAYPGRTFAAKITSVRFAPKEVNNVVTYETVLSVANPELLLRPGMTATADILVDHKERALLVPNRALRFLPSEAAAASESGPRVWVVRDGAAVAIPVETGLTNGEVTEVTRGDVASGTELIVDIERAPRRQQQGGVFAG